MGSERIDRVTLVVAAALAVMLPRPAADSAALAPPGRGEGPLIYDTWRTYTTRNGLPSDKAFAVRAYDDRVWVGTDHGLAYLKDGEWHTIGVDDGLAHSVVLSIDVNPTSGDVWIGTLGGLNRWSAGRLETFNQFNSGLANDVVYGVAAEGDEVWVATAAGASRLKTGTGEWSIFDADNAPMHEPWIYGVDIGGGLVYLAAWGGGVLEFTLATERWRDYRDPDGEMEIDLFPDDGLVHDVTVSVSYEEGLLWTGTYFGLSRYDGVRWQGYFDHDSGLISNFINFVKARGETVWVCTDQGLSSFDGSTWVTYQRDTIVGGGEVLIGTGPEPEVRRRTRSAIAHNNVYGVDFQGDTVWVATASGVSAGFVTRAVTADEGEAR
ncbi:MAG: regulator [Gemmatimonadales bacterium]